MIRKISPTRVRVEGEKYQDRMVRQVLRDQLTYHDKSMDFQIAKFRRARWYQQKFGEEAFQERLKEMKAQTKVCLLDEDSTTHGGLGPFLAEKFQDVLCDEVVYPEPRLIPWNKTPPSPYPFQQEALEALLKSKHGAVEIGTGGGKSLIIVNLIKELGLKTVIMSPFTNISEQLYADLLNYFGKAKVGRFYGSKKESKKLITIANGASLTRLEPDSEHYQNFLQAQVFISDESHFTPAATFEKVCVGLGANAPYRFFMSATQIRNDGSDLLLKGITGEIVYTKTVRQLVDDGYLAKPNFFMLEQRSDSGFDRPDDPMEMTRTHLFYNTNVLAAAAEIANKSVSLLGHPVLMLIEEIDQFVKILPFFRHTCQLAHGGNASKSLPAQYQKSDPQKLVAAFNAKEIPILVGTSCVSTGTNFKAVKTLIYLQGGKSEPQVRQAIGRSTRLFEDKKECNIFDFDVTNIPLCHRHARTRMAIYNDIYGPVKEVPL